MTKKTTIILFGLFLILSLPFTKTEAAADYISQIKIDAKVQNNGDIEVEQDLTIPLKDSKNNFIFSLGNQKPKDIKIYDFTKEINKDNYSSFDKNKFYYISIKPNSFTNSLKITYKLDRVISFEENLETLRWSPVIAENNINNILITIHLPKNINPLVLEANLYASQNTTSTKSSIISGSKITLQANNLTSKNDISVLVRWPEGLVELSYWKKLLGGQNKIKLFLSFLLGIFLPFTALITMLTIVKRHKKMGVIPQPTETINYPPDKLAPIELGILFDKKIYPREVVAMIMSLTTKGYLVISDHGQGINLVQKKTPDFAVSTWEKRFYDQLFIHQNRKVTENDIEERVAQTLSSPDVVKLFEDVYQEITAKGFFIENPHYARIRYKVYGLLFYFLSIVTMIWTLLTNQSVLYLFPIFGLLAIAYIIIKLAPRVPTYTEKGNQERINWLRFKNWLTDKTPISYHESINGQFYTYLPYAIALGCVNEWINRFRDSAITAPDWYVSAGTIDANSFNQQIIPVIDSISTKLSSLHGPSVS